MAITPNGSSAGNRKSAPKYRVMEDQIPIKDSEGNPIPNKWETIYYIELISTGKRLERTFVSLEEAEIECENLNQHTPS